MKIIPVYDIFECLCVQLYNTYNCRYHDIINGAVNFL